MIKIEISGTNPLETFAQAAVYGLKLMQIPEVTEAADIVIAIENHWKSTTAAQNKAETGNPVSVPKAPAVPPECDTLIPEPESQPPAPTAEKATVAHTVPTAEEVRAKGVAAGQKHGNAAVKAILKELGVTKMSDLAESDRAVFLQKLESLGDDHA